MARNRMIKVDFFSDGKIGKLDALTKLLFIGAWCFADDTGVVKADPLFLRSSIFPLNNIDIKDIKESLEILVENNLFFHFIYSSESYFFIKNFAKHQTINRPSKFTYIDGANKHNILELIHSLSAHGVITEYSLMKVKEKEKVKVKVKVKEKEKVNILSGNESPDSVHLEILNFLNLSTQKKFKLTNKVKTLINARLEEDFTLENFKTVINKKTEEWLLTDMNKYLRPETLFSNKFQSYLNQQNYKKLNKAQENQDYLLNMVNPWEGKKDE